MLISVRHLVDRLRYPRTRADELAELRWRLARAAADGAPQAERALAVELRALRRELAALVGTLTSCAGCARGTPLPGGRWDGGHCCSGATADIFDDDEVAALALAGTTPDALVAPRGDHAGCAFRGAAGCTLELAARPNICVHYLCRDATRELHARGVLDEVERLTARLGERLATFRAARRARELEAAFSPP